MAVTPRSGADGTGIAIGFQPEYGKKLTKNSEMVRFPSGHRHAGLIKMFPCSAIDFDESRDVAANNLITSFGADPRAEFGPIHYEGGWTTGVLIEEILHFLCGILNPDSIPVSSALGTVAVGTSTPTPDSPEVAMATLAGQPAFPWPCQFQITGGTRTADASVVIEGYAQGARPDEDQLWVRESLVISGDTPIKSKTFWKSITKITTTGITGSPGRAWVPDTHHTKVSFSTTGNQFPGWTIMWRKGGSPGVCQDVIPSEVSVSASETGIDVTVSCLGTRGEEHHTIEGGDVQQARLAQSEFADADTSRAQGWAGALQFGDDIVKYTSMDLSVNRNLTPGRGVDASLFRRGVSPDGNRQVLFTPTFDFLAPEEQDDTYRNWQYISRVAQDIPLKYEMYNFGVGGRVRKVVVNVSNAGIETPANYVVGGVGPIDQTVGLKALPSASGTSEIEIEIFSESAYSRG